MHLQQIAELPITRTWNVIWEIPYIFNPYDTTLYVLEAVSTSVRTLAEAQMQSAAAVAARKLGYNAMKDKQRDYVLWWH